MTTEQQNIAIAEALGWKLHSELDETWCAPHQTDCPLVDELVPRPNYHGSLDACAEFEARLEREQRFRYVVMVGHLVKAGEKHQDGFTFTIMTAPAAIRCESYLRTIGKWCDSSTTQPT